VILGSEANPEGDPTRVLAVVLIVVGLLAVVAVGWLVWLMRARIKFAAALQQYDFAKALDLGAKLPRVLARRPICRYGMSLAALGQGDRQRAVAELEKLYGDAPHFKAAALTLSLLYLDEGQLASALELAQRTASELKKDPLPRVLLARTYERLDQLDDAQRAAAEALALDREDAGAWTVTALVAGRRGDYEQADHCIATALEHAPGDPYVLAVQAKLAVAQHGAQKSRELIDAALAAIQASPFNIMKTEAAQLRAYSQSPDQPAGGLAPSTVR
jgi:tetratricopeptide (TPR) repeat protein